ncbi:hypothetical protein BCR39DRAFT_508322 [Naematelia encephala]|uniref:Uncharacterized protein n=1 Tax=Naematelia encephala TaxID=71784 RepID=A0A1Y2AHG9_9TREE|nr:hypothetical protein BCR39DRAFT_508322 [Naematelia encephala]
MSDSPQRAHPLAFLDNVAKVTDRSLYHDVHPAEGLVMKPMKTVKGDSKTAFYVLADKIDADPTLWTPTWNNNATLQKADLVFEPTLMIMICKTCKVMVRNVSGHLKSQRPKEWRPIKLKEFIDRVDTFYSPSPTVYFPHFDPSTTSTLSPYHHLPLKKGIQCQGCGHVASPKSMCSHQSCGKANKVNAHFQSGETEAMYGKYSIPVADPAKAASIPYGSKHHLLEIAKSYLPSAPVFDTNAPDHSLSMLLRKYRWHKITEDWTEEMMTMSCANQLETDDPSWARINDLVIFGQRPTNNGVNWTRCPTIRHL